jgi:hypothetical protein
MHVPLSRPQIGVAGQFLNGSCRRTAHREMRTQVTENVNPAVHHFAARAEPADRIF